MNEKEAYIVKRLKQYLIDHYNPDMIILYGSTARGDTDEFSDIDIMVIIDVEDSKKLTDDILADTDHIVHDKHIIIKSTDEYFTQKDIPGTMVFSALNEGLVQYCSPDFDAGNVSLKKYEERKRDVIEREYLVQAREFLEEGKKAFNKKQLFRCRDFLRFAAVRALKAVMVLKDVHPPRSTDLDVLFKRAQTLIPQIKTLQPSIKELNYYYPINNEPEEVSRCRELAEKTRFIIDSVALHIM